MTFCNHLCPAVTPGQASCSWEHRRRQDPAQRPSSAGSVPRAGSPPRWAARPVASDQPAENAVTLPCEFCEQAFLDADLLRHQVSRVDQVRVMGSGVGLGM